MNKDFSNEKSVKFFAFISKFNKEQISEVLTQSKKPEEKLKLILILIFFNLFSFILLYYY